MKHRSHRFSIDYVGADGQKRGQEYCHVTVHRDGCRTLRATSEIFDSEVLRDVVYTVDAAYRPRELLVRVSVQDRFVGSGWFQIGETLAEGESLTAAEGRLSQRLTLASPAVSFITHAVSSDVWHAASIPRIADPAGVVLDPVLTCSPRHNGSTGPILSFWPLRAFYVGEEAIETPAGRFTTHHIRYEELSGELFLDTWCTADGDRVMVKMWYPPYQSSYLLTSLVHDPL